MLEASPNVTQQRAWLTLQQHGIAPRVRPQDRAPEVLGRQEVMHVWHMVRLSSQALHTSANMLESGKKHSQGYTVTLGMAAGSLREEVAHCDTVLIVR